MNEAVPSVVAIDIGTHKVSVLIGKVHAPDNIQVIGMATARNRGMNKGKIVSLDKVITAIKNAVQEAEDMAECRVHSAWVSIPSAELKAFMHLDERQLKILTIQLQQVKWFVH
jgi:cell division protein FtsA